MKDTYIDGEKLARNGRKTATYYAASFLPHYRRVLFWQLLVFNLWSDPKIHGCGKTTEFLTVSTKKNHFNGPLSFASLSLNSANISPLSEVKLACKDTCKNFLVSAVCILAEAVNGGRKNNERMLSAPPCHGSSIIS